MVCECQGVIGDRRPEDRPRPERVLHGLRTPLVGVLLSGPVGCAGRVRRDVPASVAPELIYDADEVTKATGHRLTLALDHTFSIREARSASACYVEARIAGCPAAGRDTFWTRSGPAIAEARGRTPAPCAPLAAEPAKSEGGRLGSGDCIRQAELRARRRYGQPWPTRLSRVGIYPLIGAYLPPRTPRREHELADRRPTSVQAAAPRSRARLR